MIKVIFKDAENDNIHFLFADNIVFGETHILVSKSLDYPTFRKTTLWNIPRDLYIAFEKVRKE